MKKIEIWEALRRKYPENAYALMAEVRDEAGMAASRSADYVAISLWPSRGLAITGIELKSYRSDWLNELKNPKKAENIFQYCDNFYLLTTDDKVARIEEIPETWGWMCIKGSTIRVLKQAPVLKPIVPTKSFMVCLLRRAVDKKDYVHRESIQDKIEESKQYLKDSHEKELQRFRNDIQRQKDQVKEFEDAAGVKFGTWDGFRPEDLGAAVKFLKSGGIEGIRKDLKRLETQAGEVHKNISTILNTNQ